MKKIISFIKNTKDKYFKNRYSIIIILLNFWGIMCNLS